MKPPDEVRREFVRQWIVRAEEDWAAARHLLQATPVLSRPVGFHAQQATEKFLKAYLVWRQVDFPKTHNIANLLDLISGVDRRLAVSLDAAAVLTKYAVEARYPGDPLDISEAEAQASVNLAEHTREHVLVEIAEALQLGQNPDQA